MSALPKPKRERSEEYLDFVRSQSCVVAKHQAWSHGCKGPVEAHHVTLRMGGKVGSKADDKRALPFCHSHHLEYHALGSMDEFEKRYPVLLDYEVLRLNKLYQPKVKQKREKRVGIQSITVNCRCVKGYHNFPPSKVVHTETGLHWDCPILRERIEVA